MFSGFQNTRLQVEAKFLGILVIESEEAAHQRCSYKNLFWKYAANLQENTHTEVQFQ